MVALGHARKEALPWYGGAADPGRVSAPGAPLIRPRSAAAPSWSAGDPSVAVVQSGHRPNAHVGPRWSDGRSTRRKIWCSRISEGVPQASDQAVARHRVWQRWPETATRLRPCRAGQAGTDARLRPAAWPLRVGRQGRAGIGRTGGDGRAMATDLAVGVRVPRGAPLGTLHKPQTPVITGRDLRTAERIAARTKLCERRAGRMPLFACGQWLEVVNLDFLAGMTQTRGLSMKPG